MKHTVFVMFGLFLLAGCVEPGARTEDATMPVGGGESFVTMGITYENIWQAAEQALAPEFVVTDSNRYKGEIKARKPATKKTKEERIGVYVLPLGKGSGSGYRVKVMMLKGAPGRDKNWEEILMERIRAKLG